MPSIFVLYADFGQYEGCSAPEEIVYTEEEARAFIDKNPECNTYSEFEIDVEKLEQQQAV